MAFQDLTPFISLLSVHEVQKHSLSDCQQLEYAIAEGRAIFTFNAGDFNRLHKKFIENRKSHFGILLSKQIPISETIKRLVNFLYTHVIPAVFNPR